MDKVTAPPLDRLAAAMAQHERLVLAVSGGVDSLTLAHAAMRAFPGQPVEVCHAVSPAVPAEATERVKTHAARNGWRLRLLDAKEFSDPDYLRNPVNRCYFCKSNLYDRIRGQVDGTIASGANTDDLGDYRPGLTAARERGVVHPFVEAGCSKADVRAMARQMGLEDIRDLPAQPCLASRIETGLRIDPDDLAFVSAVETALARIAPGQTLRCRIVQGGVRVEVPGSLLRNEAGMAEVTRTARALCSAADRPLLDIAAYRRGSAFLHAS